MIEFFTALGQKQQQPIQYDVINLIIWGQSNAQQNTGGDNIDPQYEGEITNAEIYDYSGNQFLTLNYPQGAIDGNNFGIEFTFAYRNNQVHQVPVLIGKRAEGGTNLQSDWQDGTALNNNLKEAVNQLKARNTSEGYTNPLWIFYGNQGEADANSGITQQGYVDAWDSFFNNLESETSLTFDKIILCQINENLDQGIYQDLNNVRAAVAEIVASESRYILIDMSDYTLDVDNLHYPGSVAEALGIRVYDLAVS